ncbi:MAG: ABC transporter permease subunit [Castellaniella sp.]
MRGWHLPAGRTLAIVPPFVWLVLVLLLPFVLVFKISLADLRFGIPPYTDLAVLKDETLTLVLNLRGYALLFSDSLYLSTYLNSVRMALVTTVICALIGYPMAYVIARAHPRVRNMLLLAVILPFWTSLLLRVYAWVGLLRNDGLINKALLALGLISEPLEMYRTDFAVYVGLVYAYLPFFILPLYASLVRLDMRLLEAAYDLGARPWRAFLGITLPQSMPGVTAGAMLVFIPAVGEYVIPEMLGGADTLMMGRVMWTEFFNNADWPMAAAVTCVMVLLLLVPLVLFQYAQMRQLDRGGRGGRGGVRRPGAGRRA